MRCQSWTSGFAGVCACHANGYIREAAVARLSTSTNGAEVPFLLWRSNDWVAPVAIRARAALGARLIAEYAEQWVRCLGLVERLARTRRNDHRDTIASIEGLLFSPEGRHALDEGLRSLNPWIRRRCWRLQRKSGQHAPVDVADAATRDRDPVIRKLAYDAILNAGTSEQRDRNMENARHDPATAIRSLALDYWIRSTNPSASLPIHASLFDRAPEVRARAAFVWRQRTGQALGPVYRSALATAKGVQLIGAIYGLGETGAARDTAQLSPYMSHARALVRIAAIRAMWRLDQDVARPFLVEALFRDSPHVAREARVCLERALAVLDLPELWRRASSGSVQRRLLTMVRKLGKWDRVGYILPALSSDDPDTVAFARGELIGWNDAFNKTYQPLTRSHRDDLLTLLAGAKEDLREELIRLVRFTILHS